MILISANKTYLKTQILELQKSFKMMPKPDEFPGKWTSKIKFLTFSWEFGFRIQVSYRGHFSTKMIILSRRFDIFHLKWNIFTENQQEKGSLKYNRGGLVSISKLIVTFVSLNNFIFCYFGLCWINELNFVTSTCSVLNLTIVIR